MNGEDSELSDYPGEDEDLGEEMEDGDFGETGQISPTQTTPEKESDYENNKSENIRQFMDQAQPGSMHIQNMGQNDQSEDKEGGSIDQFTNRENPYNNITESSPEISKTDADQSNYPGGDDMPSSSFQDTPMSSQNIEPMDVNNIQELNMKAQQIAGQIQ